MAARVRLRAASLPNEPRIHPKWSYVMARTYTCTFGSEMVHHKTARAKVKQLLRKMIEPEPKYRTGKFWTD